MIVKGDHVAEYMRHATGIRYAEPFECLGIEEDGVLKGAILLNGLMAQDVSIHVFGCPWPKDVTSEIGRYVFDQLKCERMTFVTEDPTVVSFAEELGGKVEGLLRNKFGKNRDAFLVGIIKNEFQH